MKATGTNTASSTNVIAMIGAKMPAIARLVASPGDKLGMGFHHLLDGLDDDDGVVDHDADRKDHGEERDGVGGITDGV